MMIDGHTRVLGLLGDPVEHTLSPVIHNELCRKYGMNGVYVPFHTRKGDLKEAVFGAYAMNILGLNVTVPHKNEVIQYLADIDEGAAAIGAVNTLVRTDGGFVGYNTDMMGLSREVDYYGIELKDKCAVILGAGGAARAVAFMCMNKGAKTVYILNRTLEKAQKIADDMNSHFGREGMKAMRLCDYMSLCEVKPEEGYVVFQSTSIGLSPNVDDVVIEDESFYDLVSVGVDLIYMPYETRFMRLCRKAGKAAYNGLRMLLYQGIVAYELWNDVRVDDKLAESIYGSLERAVRKNVVLIGFMGSGKSTVGRALAKKLDFDFVDMDEYIENMEGCSVSEIFSKNGEEYFRELETVAIEELSRMSSHTVIATGGGAPMRTENAQLMKKTGRVIYLRTTPAEVVRRLSGDTGRPLLAGGDVQSRVSELMEQRSLRYESAADDIIDVTGVSVGDIMAKIQEVLENGREQ